jgi:hypothetical protein
MRKNSCFSRVLEFHLSRDLLYYCTLGEEVFELCIKVKKTSQPTNALKLLLTYSEREKGLQN